MRLPRGPHLTYCTNIHPGEHWSEVRAALRTHTLGVKARLAPDRPFAVGLRLSAKAARELEEEGIEAFADWLGAHDLYVNTLNGFPYGTFHGSAVKESVYLPDWSEPERLEYTLCLARILAKLLPTGQLGSISTVPGCFRPLATPERRQSIARGLVDAAEGLWLIAEHEGAEVVLALEPEPDCLLETSAEAVAFLENWVYRGPARSRFEARTGLHGLAAEAALRRHMGVCLDLCHAAVAYDEPDGCVGSLRQAGVRAPKVQISAGLQIPQMSAEAHQALQAFADPVYLHQVRARGNEGVRRYVDLAPALAAWRERPLAEEWRVHFHVPLFRQSMGVFRTTAPFVQRTLETLAPADDIACLEVETYTWDVLPPEYRDESIVDAIARELSWVEQEWVP